MVLVNPLPLKMEPFPNVSFIDVDGSGNQEFLERTLKNHGRMRDQFQNYSSSAPDQPHNYILCNIIAKYFNSTLITYPHPHGGHETVKNYTSWFPLILTDVLSTAGSHQIKYIWDSFYPPNGTMKTPLSELPTFIKKSNYVMNFAYCSFTRQQLQSTWNFSIFSNPFDMWTWLVLVLIILLVSWLVSRLNHRNFFVTFLSALATLLDNEMTHIFHSKLYVLWLFTSLLIFDLYLGAITSQVIAPPEEAYFTKLADLERNNFTLVFPNPGYFREINQTLAKMETNLHPPQKIKVIKELLKTSNIINFDGGNFIKAIAETPSTAAFLWWPHAIFVATRAIDHNIRLKGILRRKKCFVGKDMFRAGEVFVAFIPPGSVRIGRVFQELLAFGIVQWWEQEYYGLLQSARVQDRARVKSWTRLAKEETSVEALKMKGKPVIIFFLWILCLINCFAFFLIEKYGYFCRLTWGGVSNLVSEINLGVARVYKSSFVVLSIASKLHRTS